MNHIYISRSNNYIIKLANIIDDLSHHNLHILNCFTNDSPFHVVTNKIISKIDYSMLYKYFQQNSFECVFEDVELYYDEFLNYISKGIDLCSNKIIVCNCGKSYNKNWVTNEFLILLKLKEKWYKKPNYSMHQLSLKWNIREFVI